MRSTVWTLLVTAFVGVGLSAIVTSAEAARWCEPHACRAGEFIRPVRVSPGFSLRSCVGVLGVLVVSVEYSTGTIRATSSAAPRRPLVLLAKIAVFGAVAVSRR